MTVDDAELSKFISSDALARRIFLSGFEAGHLVGWARADQTAADEYADHARKFAKSAAQWIDVAKARAA